MGDKDPASLTSLSAADYHGNSQRGTAARRMLDPPGPPAKLPGDAFKVDVLQDKVWYFTPCKSAYCVKYVT